MTIEEILAGESKNVEFKVQRPDKSMKYMKTVVTFANGKGGRIIFGIDDKTREVVGIPEDKVFREIDAITNAISDSCEPTIIPDVYLQNINDKPVIVAEIRTGRRKPYYIKAEGLENGVYIRVSGTTRPADRDMSRELYYECDARSFDSIICRDMEVTDEDIKSLCEQMKEVAIANCKSNLQRSEVKDVTKNILLSWGILKKDENEKIYPTNAYIYLTGQGGLRSMIQCAVFKGTTRAVFLDRRNYEGPLWKQVEEAVQFVFRNIRMGENYGKLDILWFDAGWVSESNGQDIELGKIVEEARKIQPWILSVDRTIGGAYENYVTPELCIPEEPLNVPWESCLTLGVDFTYEYGDHYKSPRELVGMLVNIVAKGGNMALNVSPQPDGRIPVDAWDSLNGFGQWMKTFGDAIYGTRVCAPYQSGTLSFTQKGDSVYVFRLYPTVQESVETEIFVPYTEAKISEICMVENGETVAFKEVEGGLCITVPAGYRRGSAPIALVFEMKKER